MYDYWTGILDWKAAGLPVEGTSAQQPRLVDVFQRDVPTCSLGERLGDVGIGPWRPDGMLAWSSATGASCSGCSGLPNSGGIRSLLVGQVMRPGPSTYRPFVPVAELRGIMS